MAELTKKLIGFDDELLEKIQKYSEKNKVTFTEAVRELINLGLNGLDSIADEGETDLSDITKRIDKLEKDMSWWNADDNESKVGNLQVQVNEMEKKLNTIVAIAKKLKGHLENREIHLQD